jgi:hypothetical protein
LLRRATRQALSVIADLAQAETGASGVLQLSLILIRDMLNLRAELPD